METTEEKKCTCSEKNKQYVLIGVGGLLFLGVLMILIKRK